MLIFAHHQYMHIPQRCHVYITSGIELAHSIDPPNGKPFGCPKKLAELVRRGKYNPLESNKLTISELKHIAAEVEMPSCVAPTKVYCS